VTVEPSASGGPLLSVVVPVYGVEAYLAQCLDSILAGAGGDVEVVAVDDASPDGSPALLDAYAARDPRVKVRHLPTNVGLGNARNAGLDAATGDYVWFVDSDDWLPPGSVPAVLDAVRATRPDVLLVDHVRVHEDGRTETDPSSAVLRGVTGAGPLADRERLLDLQHTAWNKVVRRAFLADLGLRFHSGWYEDFPFSHPLLVAADRIAVLDRVCYHYRQRDAGAITRTVDDRHLEALDQYERLFADLDRLGPRAAPFRAHLVRLMVNHYLVIVGNGNRVPPRRRAEFFHRAAAHYRRYRPPTGYRHPGGVAGLKHRMLAADAYRPYALLRLAYRLPGAVRRRRAPAPAPEPADAGLGGMTGRRVG
jgi:glycosyltransferase involved in cell wall biosynthesis